MATRSHTIYSRYDPPQTHETHQQLDGIDTSAAWQYDTSFGPQRALPPRFVPASGQDPEHATSPKKQFRQSHFGENLSSWYRSLRNDQQDKETPPESPGYNETAAIPSQPLSNKSREKRNKNNWFIMNALQSQPTNSLASPSPSLADIIARDPPPLSAEEKYSPPVWLSIGPSNKGFAMLQRSGWNEGEPLGPDVVRHRWAHLSMTPFPERAGEHSIKEEIQEISVEGYDDVSELRRIDVIDLTLDADPEDDSCPGNTVGSSLELTKDPEITLPTTGLDEPVSSGGRTALLTPIATVLKSDRLGIGLKAKTVGPYKASQKRVTHSAAAMAAHIRAAEESRKWRERAGRGNRGYTKKQKQEQAERKRMLAYLNE